MRLYLGIFTISILMCNCTEKTEPYSFFVAGHVYGSPYESKLGVYDKFESKFDLIKSTPFISFGVLTGDAVKKCQSENWDSLLKQMEELNLKFYLAPGNHDKQDLMTFNKYWSKSYDSFKKGMDLHILLDGNLDHWKISGEQLTFLKKELADLKGIKNVFIYSHQVLWYNPKHDYIKVLPNSEFGLEKPTNFYSEILPLLEQVNIPVYMFSGDVGAGSWASSFTYHQVNNVHLISSGMGSGENDNFLIASVNSNSEVKIDLISIDSENISEMGTVHDHIVSN